MIYLHILFMNILIFELVEIPCKLTFLLRSFKKPGASMLTGSETPMHAAIICLIF